MSSLPYDSRHHAPSSRGQRLAKQKSDNTIKEENFKNNHIWDIGGDLRPQIKFKRFKEGTEYRGQMNKKGLREGKGHFSYKENNDVYFGDWKNDKFHGRGTYIFSKGDRYEGNLEEGMKHGEGNYYYANGNVYRGQWYNDRKHGVGVFEYANTNEKYEGGHMGFILKTVIAGVGTGWGVGKL